MGPVKATVVALLASAVFTAAPGAACQCGGQPDVAGAFASAAAVFEGQALALEPVLGRIPEISASMPLHGWRLRVLRVWKGQPGREVEIADDAGNCSFAFRTGVSYLVFAQAHRTLPGHFSTTICAATQALASPGEPIAELGQATVIQGPLAPRPETLVHAVGRVLLASWYTAWSFRSFGWQRLADSGSVTAVVVRYSVYLAAAVLVLLAALACARGRYRRVLAVVLVLAFLTIAAALLGGYEVAAHNMYLEDLVRLKH